MVAAERRVGRTLSHLIDFDELRVCPPLSMIELTYDIDEHIPVSFGSGPWQDHSAPLETVHPF